MKTSLHRAVALIDLAAITHNARTLRERAGVDLMAVLKADAYGHGLIPVARAAIAGGATWLGTALLQEALELRKAGIDDVRVMAWLTPPGDQYREAIKHDIDLSAGSVESVEEIAGIAKKMKRKARPEVGHWVPGQRSSRRRPNGLPQAIYTWLASGRTLPEPTNQDTLPTQHSEIHLKKH
jgi:predicted amino acid racemase